MYATKKAVIYARVSTDDQKKNYSLKTQVDECEKYARANSYEVIDILKEKL
jgi:DNA invertase Pin-like site-specific DNA recombinase